METESQESKPQREALINSFCEIASATKEEALFFLESHNWDLDAAVTTFLDDNDGAAADFAAPAQPPPPSGSPSPADSPDYSPSRSRSPSPAPAPAPAPSRRPYALRSRPRGGGDMKPSGSRARGVRTLSDLNRTAEKDSGSDSDEPQEYYTGGEKSGMLVQDPTKANNVDTIFNQAKQASSARGSAENLQPSSSSKSFTGTARLLTGETVSSAPQPPEVVNHTITFWRNGFSVDDGPLRRLDDPENAPFLESIKKSECPQELVPADEGTPVHVEMRRREEDYPEPVKRKVSFQGVGRTLGSGDASSSAASASSSAAATLNTAPLPSMGLVVDDSLPLTSLQLRLADGTRMVSRFNYHHTIRDILSFIDASRPGGPRSYQLQTMGFPPKLLTDLDQTIELAGIANSVVIQKL